MIKLFKKDSNPINVFTEYCKSIIGKPRTSEEFLDHALRHIMEAISEAQTGMKTNLLMKMPYQINGLDTYIIEYFKAAGIEAFVVDDKRLPDVYLFFDWKPKEFVLKVDNPLKVEEDETDNI